MKFGNDPRTSMVAPTNMDRRVSHARTALSYEMDPMHAATPARARRRRQAKREWSRANRRYGKALTRNAL